MLSRGTRLFVAGVTYEGGFSIWEPQVIANHRFESSFTTYGDEFIGPVQCERAMSKRRMQSGTAVLQAQKLTRSLPI